MTGAELAALPDEEFSQAYRPELVAPPSEDELIELPEEIAPEPAAVVERSEIPSLVSTLDYQPPQSVEAEQHVLGGLILDNAAWARIAGIVARDDFYRADHRTIFQHIGDLIDGGNPADVFTVAEHLERSGKLADIGGQPYLGSLAANIPSAANIRRYAEIVAHRARARDLAALGNDLAVRASMPGADVAEIVREAEASLAGVRPVSRRRTTLDWAAIAASPPGARDWALHMWLLMNTPALLVGAGGAGKTILLLQLGACLTLARSFIDAIPKARRVLIWNTEDSADELARMMLAIAAWLNVDLSEFRDHLFVEARLGLDNTLFTIERGRPQFTPAFDELRTQANDVHADVVLLDNSAQLYGADENNRHEVTTFMNGLKGAHRGRAIVLGAHTSRQENSEFSGSSAWENAVRTRLYLGLRLPDSKSDVDEAPDGDVRYLARRKANYGPLDWRKFTYTNGVLVPDVIEDTGGIVGHARKASAERIVLDGLRRLSEMGKKPDDSKNSNRYLPRLLGDYRLADGHSKTELGDAMRRLQTAGKLVTVVVGKYSNRSPMNGLKAAE